MKTKVAIFAVAAILLVGGGVFVMSSRKNTSTTVPGGSPTPTETQSSVKTGNMSMRELLTAGVPEKCTYSGETEGINSSGTAYVAGGKVRTDFVTTVSGKTTDGHMIYDGVTGYIWTDGQTTGFKLKIDPDKLEVPENAGSTTTDFNKNFDYNCAPWIPDAGQFTPPAEVKFSEFTMPSISGAAPGASGSGSQDLCKYCDSLSGEQKTQCKTSLKCS